MTGYSVNMFIAPVVSPSVASFGITHADNQITVSGSFDMRAAEGNTGASIMEDLGKLLSSPVLMLV
jgi:pyruvate/2-oxoglutarate dehydrogenase complex dihydrolipoamide acyltransferase (E2) component